MENDGFTRNQNIDIIKGIGICLVVLGHSHWWGDRFVNLFHMAVFFIAAGYCYNDKYSQSMRQMGILLKKRLKSLYLPYVISNLILLCFHNLFVKIQIYTDNPLFMTEPLASSVRGLISYYSLKDFLKNFILIVGFVGGEQLEGSVWFLRIIFELTIGYAVLHYITKRWKKYETVIDWVVSVISLLFGWYLSLKGIMIVAGLHIAFSCFIFFTIGVTLKKYSILEKISDWLVVGICLPVLIICYRTGYVSVAANSYSSPVLLVVSGICGWCLLWELGKLLIKIRAERPFVYMGQKTMYILLLHFLVFKIVTYVYIQINHLPTYMLASFPVLMVDHMWIIYALTGILIPLGIAGITDWVRNRAKKRRHA